MGAWCAGWGGAVVGGRAGGGSGGRSSERGDSDALTMSTSAADDAGSKPSASGGPRVETAPCPSQNIVCATVPRLTSRRRYPAPSNAKIRFSAAVVVVGSGGGGGGVCWSSEPPAGATSDKHLTPAGRLSRRASAGARLHTSDAMDHQG